MDRKSPKKSSSRAWAGSTRTLNAFNLLAIEVGQPRLAAELLASARGLDRFHAGDAIHLHTALQLAEVAAEGDRVILVTTDEGFKVVAGHHGMPVLDPRKERSDDLARLFGRD